MEERRSTRCAPADNAAIAKAAASLREGGLVAMPTETVYGLAADATSDSAVASIYAAKGRPSFNPLIAHVSSVESAATEALLDRNAQILARAFWPGPLTIVAPVAASCSVSLLARAGLDTLALRIPAHPVARALIEAAGVPLAAPSANRSGHVSPTDAQHVRDDLDGRIDWILDGGRTALGLESTIVACLGGAPALLRPGAAPVEAIEAALGRALARNTVAAVGEIRAPGQLESHYAPRAALRLDATEVGEDEAVLDFGARFGEARIAVRLDLSPSGDLAEAASHLFAHMRALDALGASRVAVAPIPDVGLGVAINDRLRRAAAPRRP